jgi:TolB-like protein/Tfp pilus assembly protein PilF
MSGILEGYNYDIFISYRQKDNKGDRWVSEFVEALKTELESTFKEEINVYFDINPHDGLLETHDVDESLKEKLKCLVFIPIISRTYCDPKSFAWVHEFKPFVEKASNDQFGLKVKLPNGNVASRVLPIRIHDLDSDDIKLCESVLSGVLRGIEFIYKEPGIDKPLAPGDNEKKNLNNTIYRIQIIKVAHAIKEIISGLKTEPVVSVVGKKQPEESKTEIKKEDDRKELIRTKVFDRKSKRRLIILLSIFLCVFAAFMIFKIVNSRIALDKSIVVLPFITPTDTNAYLINSIRDEVNNNLQKIKVLKIVSRYSADKYNDPTKFSPREIAKELNVNYLVSGKGQKYGATISLTVELIEAIKDRILWSKPYKQEIRKPEDFTRLQSQIAQDIVAALNGIITPEEKQLIEKIPTTNVTAYDFYQKAREEEANFFYYDLIATSTTLAGLNPSTKQSIERTKKMYKKAVEYDSSFAPAYTGLAVIYWSENYYREYFSENFLDSVLILANKALSYDDQLPDAYYIRGMYYSVHGIYKQALEEFDKTLKYNPNYWLAYYGKGLCSDDCVMAINNFKEAASRHHGSGLSEILKNISIQLSASGFSELAKSYILEAIKLEPDSSTYYFWLWMHEFNYKKCFEFYEKEYLIDSTDLTTLEFLLDYYSRIGEFKESLRFCKKWFDRLKLEGRTRINGMQRVGYAYWKNELRDSADYYFNKQIEFCNDAIRLGRPYGISGAYYDLAGVYAFMRNKINAYENLKWFNQKSGWVILWIVRYIKNDPLFDSIRNEPEFQNIMKDMDAKYQAEHERVRKWLEDQGML